MIVANVKLALARGNRPRNRLWNGLTPPRTNGASIAPLLLCFGEILAAQVQAKVTRFPK